MPTDAQAGGKRWIVIASVNGFLAVALGAFAAHGLKEVVPVDNLSVFEVGVRYQMYHALALLAIGFSPGWHCLRLVRVSGSLFLAGILLFSGSLYALTFLEWRWLGPITPLGGLCFLTGWFSLALAAFRFRSP